MDVHAAGITSMYTATPKGAEKIFPFDLLPRHHPGEGMGVSERGLAQRITALKSFSPRHIHEQKI